MCLAREHVRKWAYEDTMPFAKGLYAGCGVMAADANGANVQRRTERKTQFFEGRSNKQEYNGFYVKTMGEIDYEIWF